MRTIKFKAKRKDNNEWVRGNLIHRTKFYGSDDDTHFILEGGEFDCDYYFEHEVTPETISEFTGLHDKKEMEIYENDIVRWQNVSGKFYNAVVKFGEYGNMNCGFYLKWMEDIGMRPNLAYWSDKVEVVGNVFDNTDLLKAND